MKVRYPGEGLASGLQNNGLLRVPWAGLKQNNLLDFFFLACHFPTFSLLSSSWFLQNLRGERLWGSPRFLSQSNFWDERRRAGDHHICSPALHTLGVVAGLGRNC